MESQIFKRITELFAWEIVQRQGSNWLQSKCVWSGDKEERMTVHQYRASRGRILHQLW